MHEKLSSGVVAHSKIISSPHMFLLTLIVFLLMLREMTITSIINYIEDNLETRLVNIDNLVLYSGYSRRYLQIAFKYYVGIPIGKYIRLRRASRAAALLKLTRLTLVDISNKLFYDSQQTFSREFKKVFGYTPRQYRINSFWSFENLLGRKSINDTYLKPTFCYLRGGGVSGKYLDFRELILYSGVDSKTRWGRFYECLEENHLVIASNKIPFHSGNRDVLARTVLWTGPENAGCEMNSNADCEIKIDNGLYAHFSFRTTLDEYINKMYNIYYNSLPLYNLNKRDAYDIEVLKKRSDNTIDCHYYLPIHYNGQVLHNIECVDECDISEHISKII